MTCPFFYLRSNNMKISHYIFCLTIPLFISCFSSLTHDRDIDSYTLRVSFPYRKMATEYDPARIHLAPEYIFLENIYSTLVEISPKGELTPAVASRFEWIGNDAVFTIRENFRTHNGNVITANDAAFSLKRLLIKSSDAHAAIGDLLCPNKKIVSVNENCSGIVVEGNKLILRTREKKTFLFPMLASIDYAVIPQLSVDPLTLEIRDYHNTSGVYYVSEDNGGGNIVLRSNQRHFHYNVDMPQKIILVPSDADDPLDSLENYRENKIDFITTVDTVRPEDLIGFARNSSNADLHMTLNIRTFTVVFTPKGISTTTVEQRRAIGNSIRNAFYHYVESHRLEGFTPIEQYFSVFGEAGISQDDLLSLRQEFQECLFLDIPKNMKIQVVRVGDPDLWRDILRQQFSSATIEEGKNLPAFTEFKNEIDIPHFIITGPDTGWMEDVGLISYTINAGYFGMTREEGRRWIEEYTKTDEKERRLSMLRSIHSKALHNAVLIPFAGAPYVALARKPWNIGLSPFFANNQFWLITREKKL